MHLYLSTYCQNIPYEYLIQAVSLPFRGGNERQANDWESKIINIYERKGYFTYIFAKTQLALILLYEID